jgi:hypothetical protein
MEAREAVANSVGWLDEVMCAESSKAALPTRKEKFVDPSRLDIFISP